MTIKPLLAIATIVALSIMIDAAEAVNQGSVLSLIQEDLARGTETLDQASELLKKEADRGQWERYGTCVEEFRAAVFRSLPNAAADVKSGLYAAAVDELQATAQHADNCESQFAGSFVSPFSAQIKAVHDSTFQAIDAIKRIMVRRFRF